MERTARSESLYNMHKEVDSFIKGNLPEGFYENRVPGGPLGDRGVIQPGEMAHERYGNIVDPQQIAVATTLQPEGPGVNLAPLSPERLAENQKAVDNINENNEELGLKSKSRDDVERIASGPNKAE